MSLLGSFASLNNKFINQRSNLFKYYTYFIVPVSLLMIILSIPTMLVTSWVLLEAIGLGLSLVGALYYLLGPKVEGFATVPFIAFMSAMLIVGGIPAGMISILGILLWTSVNLFFIDIFLPPIQAVLKLVRDTGTKSVDVKISLWLSVCIWIVADSLINAFLYLAAPISTSGFTYLVNSNTAMLLFSGIHALTFVMAIVSTLLVGALVINALLLPLQRYYPKLFLPSFNYNSLGTKYEIKAGKLKIYPKRDATNAEKEKGLGLDVDGKVSIKTRIPRDMAKLLFTWLKQDPNAALSLMKTCKYFYNLGLENKTWCQLFSGNNRAPYDSSIDYRALSVASKMVYLVRENPLPLFQRTTDGGQVPKLYEGDVLKDYLEQDIQSSKQDPSEGSEYRCFAKQIEAMQFALGKRSPIRAIETNLIFHVMVAENAYDDAMQNQRQVSPAGVIKIFGVQFSHQFKDVKPSYEYEDLQPYKDLKPSLGIN